MKKLIDPNDLDLQEKSLSLANCLLKTKTLKIEKLKQNLADTQWKDKNKEILKTLLLPFNLVSLDALTTNFTVDDKIKFLAEQISKINDSDFVKNIEDEINKINEKLVPFILLELYDDAYIDWDSFVEKFNDEGWRNNEKNKASIGELTKLFKCQTEEIFQKINGLDEEIKDQAKKLLQDKHDSTKMIKELENDKNEKEKDIEQLNAQIGQLKVPFKLLQLCDENSYTDWDSFVAKFKDENWKKEEKNMKIIGELCAIWKCQSNEIYDKINGLDEEIKDQAKKLLQDKHRTTMSENDKKELILSCLVQLGSDCIAQFGIKNYDIFDKFSAKFDDKEWKSQHQQLITSLAKLLNHDYHEISQKTIISSLTPQDKEIVMKLIKENIVYKLLQETGAVNLKDLSSKYNEFKKLNDINKHICSLKSFCDTIQTIHSNFSNLSSTTTIKDLEMKCQDVGLSISQKKMLTFLCNVMKRLKVQTIYELFKRIDYWCEVLKFITNNNDNDTSTITINQLIHEDLDKYKND